MPCLHPPEPELDQLALLGGAQVQGNRLVLELGQVLEDVDRHPLRVVVGGDSFRTHVPDDHLVGVDMRRPVRQYVAQGLGAADCGVFIGGIPALARALEGSQEIRSLETDRALGSEQDVPYP